MARNKYPEETVQKILDASLKLFLEKGYEQTTILDIVDNMGGLTRGAFYHHFKSKEEVLDALMRKMVYQYEPFEKVRNEQGLSGLEKIKTIIKMSSGFYKDESFMVMSSAATTLLSNPRIMVEHVKGIQRIARLLEPLIAEGMADGSIKSGNPKVLAEFFMLMFNFWLVPTIYQANREEVVDKVKAIKLMLDTLGFPVIDDEVIAKFSQFINKLEG